MSQPTEKVLFEGLTLFNSKEFQAFHTGNEIERAEDAASFAILDELSDSRGSASTDISLTAEFICKLANQLKG